MRQAIRILGLTALLLTATGVAGAGSAVDGLWLHVRVDSDHGERVSVNLPLSLVEKAIPMIPDEHFHDGDFLLEDINWGHGHHRLSVAELRELWKELKSAPDMTFVTVEEHHETIRVSKSGDYLLVDTEEHEDESAQVRVPIAVVDALLSGEGESLDLRAAIGALAAHGEGELVAISEGDDRVRVWIDGSAAAD